MKAWTVACAFLDTFRNLGKPRHPKSPSIFKKEKSQRLRGFKNHALIELAPPGSPVVVDPPKETLYYTPPFLPQDP